MATSDRSLIDAQIGLDAPPQPCATCGFVPVGRDEWLTIVLDNLGDNARAAVESLLARQWSVAQLTGEASVLAVMRKAAREFMTADQIERFEQLVRDLYAQAIGRVPR